MKWIDARVSKPGANELVLIYVAHMFRVAIYSHTRGQWLDAEELKAINGEFVTHWTPIYRPGGA